MKAEKNPASVRLKHFRTTVLLVWVVMSLLPSAARAQQSTGVKRVLVLYWYNKDYPGNVLFEQSFRAALQASAGTFEYFAEYLESNRFPGENQSLFLRDYLRQKYADRTIDVVFAVTDAALDFLLKHRSELFSHTPIAFLSVKGRETQHLGAGPGLTGMVLTNTYTKTLDLALRLHPDAQQVFIISGTLEHDKRFETVVREELQGYESKVRLTYLTDFALHELIVKTKSLPDRSIVLYVWQQSRNEQGKVLEAVDVLDLIAPSMPVPMYTWVGTWVGHGVIGGYVWTSEGNGTRAAEITLQIANGTRAQDIPVESAPSGPMFDWRVLRRWGISEDRLPAGSIIRFKELTFWERYKWRIIGVLALCGMQAMLIVVLLAERSRRQRAQMTLEERLRFESLLSKLSAEFTDIPASKVEATVKQWLDRLKGLLGDATISFFEVPRIDGEGLTSPSDDTSSGPPALAASEVKEDEWCLAQLRRGITINLTNMRAALSSEKIGEKPAADIKSLLAIPVAVNGSIFALAFENTESYGVWAEETVSQLRQVGEIFAGALERTRAGEQLQKTRNELAHVARLTAMGEMVASITHEVNQPLGAIATYGDACVRLLSGDSPNVKKSLEAIHNIISDSMRASEVIKRIRLLVKKTAHENTLQDINQIILEVIALTERDVLSKSVALQFHLAPDLSMVLGDRVELQQVLLNLILNGIEAMSVITDRARELTITSYQHNDEQVVVMVQDSGVGLNAEETKRIFEPFVTTKPNGLGMGLSICRTILEAHGGRLWTEPNSGPGARFQFTLPAAGASNNGR